MQRKEILIRFSVVFAVFYLIINHLWAINQDSTTAYLNTKEASAININKDTIKHKNIKFLSSAGDTPLLMRHKQYLHLFSLIDSKTPQQTTKKVNSQQAKTQSIVQLPSANIQGKSADSTKDTSKNLALNTETPGSDFAKTSLLVSIAKKEVGNNIYWLITFYGIWLLLKLVFPIYHHKIFLLTEKAMFKLSTHRNKAILNNLQLEQIFFRIFSLMVYTYLAIIYFQYYPELAYFIDNDYWIFLKVFSLFLCFYLLRFLLISFWGNKHLQRSQIILHSIYSTGFAIYFLIIATIFTFLNPESSWYQIIHGSIFYIFLYFLFSKAILILREYLHNNYRIDFYLLCYLVLFEFSIPTYLLYISFLL